MTKCCVFLRVEMVYNDALQRITEAQMTEIIGWKFNGDKKYPFYLHIEIK